MIKAPALGRADLDELVALCGGDGPACKVLQITVRTLRRWRAGQPIPPMALKLLWFASPKGRQAADADLYNEVRLLRVLASATDRREKIPMEAEQFLQGLGVRNKDLLKQDDDPVLGG